MGAKKNEEATSASSLNQLTTDIYYPLYSTHELVAILTLLDQ